VCTRIYSRYCNEDFTTWVFFKKVTDEKVMQQFYWNNMLTAAAIYSAVAAPALGIHQVLARS